MKEIAEVIEKTQDRFNSIAPQNMRYEAEKGFAIQLLKNNDYLMKAAISSPPSLQQAITNIAAIGLSLNTAEKLAYLIARNVKIGVDSRNKPIFQTRIYLEPSYIGLCKLAEESDNIEWVQAMAVYDKDEFIDNGVGLRPTHTYSAFSKNRGNFVGVYCVAKLISGDYLTTIMTEEQIYSCRNRSEAWKAGQYGPWKTDFEQMAKKTVVRQAAKMWPKKNKRMSIAVDLSNDNEGFDPILTAPEIKNFSLDQKKYFDQMIEKSDAIGMAVFQKSTEETVFTNLYHSFEKGSKGKYQRVVDNLIKKGESLLFDYANMINDGAKNQDDMSLLQVVEEIGEGAFEKIKDYLTVEAISYIEKCLKQKQVNKS